MSETSIDELKAAAIAEVDPKHPLLAYHKYFKGRETEYTYREFLDTITPDEEPEPEEFHGIELTDDANN